MIRLHGIHKSYRTAFGRRRVLDGIDLTVRRGERWGILGRNGAGKSTLVRLIGGVERPTAGHIEQAMSVSWPIAFTGGLQGGLTGRDNMRFITRIYDVDYDRTAAFVDDFAELGDAMGEPVKTYSSGMRARLAFALSMAVEFDCFLIDEVLAVGDARFKAKCQEELFVKRRDRAMILVSHDPAVIRKACDHAAVLHKGKLIVANDIDHAYAIYNSL